MSNTLVIAAMKEEEDALLYELREHSHEEKAISSRLEISVRKFDFKKGALFVARSGIGPVNAALCVALIAENHPLQRVLLLGVGGALDSRLKIGDLVIAEDIIQHDSFSSLPFGNPRMLAGDYILDAEKAENYSARIACDRNLVDLLFSKASGKKWKGTVLSGSEFVGTTKRKQELATLDPDAVLVEMESAGAAQVAAKQKISFTIAKTVADRLNPGGSIESDFLSCLHASAKHAAHLLKILVEAYHQ